MKLPVLLKRLAPTRAQLWISVPFFFIVQSCFRESLPLLDFWWHLKMGQVILENGAIPRTDIFSFTAAGKLFVVQNWLSEIILYLLYRFGGGALLISFNTVLFVAVIFILWRMSLQLSHSLWASIFAAVVVALCMPVNIRPQVFSVLFFTLFYWILGSGKQTTSKRVYWLPILMILWVNMHGAFLLGLALIAVFLIVESIQWRVRAVRCGGSNGEKCIHLGSAFVLSLAATLVNPEGYAVYQYIGIVVNDTSSRLFVSEWQPPHIMEAAGIVLYFIPFLLTANALILSRERPLLIDWVLFTVFAMFGITALRNCAWFQLISAPILARHLPLVPWQAVKGLWRPESFKRSWFTLTEDSGRLRKINLALSGLLIVLTLISSPWWRSLRNGENLLDKQTPVGAANYISERRLEGNIYHPQAYGDYLLWKLWPSQRVFFDGRVHLYGEEFVRQYFRIQEDSSWEQIMAEYSIDLMLLDKKMYEKAGHKRLSLLDKARKSSNWHVIFEDDISVLLAKR